MNVLVKSSSGITQVSADSKLLSQRKVFIEGEISSESACEFIKKILILNEEDTDKPIDVLINSPGGEINSGMAIYDVIQASKAPIRMFCIGRAYSMGAVLFSSGNHGRYMLPHSELMLHEPLLGNRVSGNSSSIQSISESLLETKRRMNQILARHTGKSEEEVEKATSYDHYYSPKESREFGLCDEIVDFNKIMEN
ncbi:ATP-dependent Clp protease proteolytic subunit [Blautia wexlerae]|uniref:ClpP family protease n=1 Tax=Blautia wexlerae TaxID=418240 RepID=UPI00232F05C2|nr:ATP-dependent Clp protease proteolytic subunit [Blautia wexlerae]MDB6441002.1 ATP-dependent Clp protease proteolytic subunit [Blautia wexlerae]